MTNLSPFLSMNCSCDQALHVAKTKLSQVGLRPVQTFNLNTARLGLHDCPCPNHGTEECDCQMIILLVYGDDAEPATLILHGNDGRTWISVSGDPQRRTSKNLTTNIRQALERHVGTDL